MEDFFKSIQFKILALLAALVFAFSLHAAHTGTAIPMISRVMAFVLTPVQELSANVSYSVEQTLTELFSGPRIADENEVLRAENAELRNRLVEYDRLKAENELLKNYLEIKEKNPDFDFEPAMVIGRDADERFYSFTIDKGSSDGIKINDPVITDSGLVGIVAEVGISHAKVHTVLDATMNVGIMVSATRETGISAGELSLAREGLLKAMYLPRDGESKAGDIITTTGIGGVFPRGLTVGTIKEIRPDSGGLSLYAIVEPTLDIRNVRDVQVIKHFEGQASSQGE